MYRKGEIKWRLKDLQDKLANSFKRLKSKGKLTEADVREAMREVRLAFAGSGR